MRTFTRYMSLGLCLLVAVGCEKPPEEAPKAPEVILNVNTVDLADKPVEGVRFYINGKKFGMTDQDGQFKGRFSAKEGDVLSFNVEAPPGYSVPASVDQSKWQLTVKYPSDGRPLQVDFTAPLQRPERDFLLMVKAEKAGTPVKVNGRLVGKTGAGGNALLRVGGVPGTKFAVKAGALAYNGTFSEEDEVYLLSATRSGPLGLDAAKPAEVVAAADPVAAEPEQPTPPAEVAPAEVAPAEPAAPVQVAVAAPPPVDDDPFAGMGAVPAAPAAPVRKRTPRPEPVAEPEPVRWEPEPPPPPAPEPEPEPEPVAPPVVAAAPSVPMDDGLGDLLGDDPTPPPPPPPVVAPEPVVVAAADDNLDDLLGEPTPPAGSPAGAAAPVDLGDLLGDPPPPVEAPIAAPAAAPEASGGIARGQSARDREAAKIGGLMEDGGEQVDKTAARSKATSAASDGPSAAGMSRQEISQRLKTIKGNLGRSKVLGKADVDFLVQVERTHPGYYEANRLLAEFYYRLKDYKRQAKSLEVVTSRGRYKHDPKILLSLAKAHARVKNYRKALSTMRRVEAKMRRLPAKEKADAYRFHGEILEFEFLRQYHHDAKRANVTLVDKAISKWERYQTFSRGADAGAVAKAKKKIAELSDLKARVEL